MADRPITVLLSCEHGGNAVPNAYRKLFRPYRELLQTHRGWDPGTQQLGERWQKELGCELQLATVTRLLADLNRSPRHRSVFSEVTRNLPAAEKQTLLAHFHTPHRTRVQNAITEAVQQGQRVLHIGIHSFTPVLNGEVRTADIGLLYDPARTWEADIARQWRQLLKQHETTRVRMNYPYLGTSDGLTTFLRTQFPVDCYAGIELEINQRFPLDGGKAWRTIQSQCVATFASALATVSH